MLSDSRGAHAAQPLNRFVRPTRALTTADPPENYAGQLAAAHARAPPFGTLPDSAARRHGGTMGERPGGTVFSYATAERVQAARSELTSQASVVQGAVREGAPTTGLRASRCAG